MSPLLKNPFVLAPMAGITTSPFRRLMARMGAGALVSEFVSADGILHKSPRSKEYLRFSEDERPLGIQLFGGDENKLCEAAKVVQDTGADFVDLNLGCPVPKVTKKGGGSAWLCQPLELAQMLNKVRASVQIPLTIKIRLGWDSKSINATEICRIAENEGVHWVAIHGRTRMQGYSGCADWELISQVAQSVRIPIIGNGDLLSGPMSVARLLKSGCAGVMIGRGALKNPWIFLEACEALEKIKQLEENEQTRLINEVILKQSISSGGAEKEINYYQRSIKKTQPLPVDFVADWIRIRSDRDVNALIGLHLSLLRESFAEPKVQLHFRKFLAWYAAGYPGARELRKFVFTQSDFEQVVVRAQIFFEEIKALGPKIDESRENDPLFVSGHG